QKDVALQKDLAALTAARDENQTWLTALKQAGEATLAAVAQEAQLSKMAARDAVASFTQTATQLKEAVAKLDSRNPAHHKAVAAVAELQSKRDALKDPFAREAEEVVRPRRQMILAELRKEAAVNGGNIQPAKVPSAPPSKDETPKAAPAPAPSVVPPTKIE